MNTTRILRFLCAPLFLTISLGCSGNVNTITVGTKNFTEQIILGEIMSQLIEAKTDLEVKRTFNLGGTFVCFTALKQGRIDMYPEYTGTGLTAILKDTATYHADSIYGIVSRRFAQEGLGIWLQPFEFNNTYTITMRKEHALRLGIESISDLSPHLDSLRSGFTSEFLERPDGLPGLKKHYGLEFSVAPKELDPGLMYQAIKEKQVDVICGFATDGRIPAYDLTPLRDDKGFFPPYHAAPVVRKETLKQHPQLRVVLEVLKGTINDSLMSTMNYAVDQGEQGPASVAQKFLNNKHLL